MVPENPHVPHPSWCSHCTMDAPDTIGRAALRSFYRWAHRRGLRPDNPAELLDPVRVPPGRARPVPEDMLADVLASTDPRTRLMVLLAAYAGLRCAEIAAVHTDDLDGDLLTVTGKGRKTRVVPLAGELLELLRAHPPGYLFPSQRAPHLSSQRVSVALSEALPGAWTGHKLRHRYATRVYERSGDLMALQELLGHQSPETTRVYVRTTEDQLRAAAAAAL